MLFNRVLRDDEYFTDVTLATEGHSVKAHRVILSACSNYFHAILKTMSPCQHPVLVLQDVRSSDLNSLMDFIYFGQASVVQDSLQRFLRVAEKLKIKGLCETVAPPPPPPPPPPPSALPSHHHSAITTNAVPLPNSHVAAVVQHKSPVVQSGPGGSGVISAVPPPPPPPHAPPPTAAGAPSSSTTNFEGLLPRSPYIPEPSVVPLQTQQNLPLTSSASPNGMVNNRGVISAVVSAPPAAHQSPRQVVTATPRNMPMPGGAVSATSGVVTTVVGGQQLYYATPKRPKYSPAMSPQSILRNQLQLKEGEPVEVKAEPMAILSAAAATGPAAAPQTIAVNAAGGGGGGGGQPEDVPSSGVNVTEFITSHENDLTLQSLTTHGISPQFMFSPAETTGGDNAAAAAANAATNNGGGGGGGGGPAAPTATLVTIDDKSPIVSTANSHHLHHLSHAHVGHHHPLDEPQDLTPAPPTSPPPAAAPPGPPPAPPHTPGASNPAVGSPTPPKKDRNSRKTCPHCNKDFHEMSLKRHIKDVHFRSENTYVICPQCCKQYASQNSLYSHLNRVHGVKKELLNSSDMQLQASSAASTPTTSTASTAAAAGADNHHDGIMDLAPQHHHHSDNSN